MFTPTQIKIIKRFGKKELSFGCLVSQGGDEYQIFNFSDRFKNARYWDNEDEEAMMIMSGGYKILGHIPHLEDVFRVAEEKYVCELCISSFTDKYALMFTEGRHTIKSFFYNPTLPLLDQSESTLQELLSLFPNQ